MVGYLGERGLKAVGVVCFGAVVAHHQVPAQLLATDDAVLVSRRLVHALVAVPTHATQPSTHELTRYFSKHSYRI